MTISKPALGWKFTSPLQHPGEVLNEEFLKPNGISINGLAHGLHVPVSRISAIVNGTRGVTAGTALRLSRFFGTTPEFWLNLQVTYDLSREAAEHMSRIEREVQLHAST